MIPKLSMPEGIQMIPVDRIRVMNPRVRNQKKFKQIVENISRIGLKKPIRVARRNSPDDQEPLYDLTCGQGRLEAFIVLGEKEIPAIVEGEKNREDQYLMSLVENSARHIPTKFEHIQAIAALKDRGYSHKEIAEKIDLSRSYVQGILTLWEKGEELLLHAVEKERIPVNIAVQIARSDGAQAQKILVDLYEQKQVHGKQFLSMKRLFDQRMNYGKKGATGKKSKKKPDSAEELMRQYKQESRKQRLFVKKAKLSEARLTFVVSALKKMFGDENFRNVLHAEKLETLPAPIGKQILGKS